MATMVAVVVSDDDSYIRTSANNYISRLAKINGPGQVEIRGRSIVSNDVTMHGDLAWIRVGRYCHIHAHAVIRPPQSPWPITTTATATSSTSTAPPASSKNNNYIPVMIGSHTMIGSNTYSEAAAIGSFCSIGNNVHIGSRVMIKDCCVVYDDTIIPSDTVIPPFTRVMQSSSPLLLALTRTSTAPTTTTTIPRGGFLRTMELTPAMPVEMQQRTVELFHEFVAAQERTE